MPAHKEIRPGRLFFFGDRALYVGPGVTATLHAHRAVQICIGLSGSVRLRSGPGSRWRDYGGAMIPSNVEHESDVAAGLLASIWLEPDADAAPGLVPPRASRCISALPRETVQRVLPLLLPCQREDWSAPHADTVLAQVLDILARKRCIRPKGDARAARARALLVAAPARRVPIAELAERLAMSPSRLAHLLRSELGMPKRRYSLWLRLRDAVETMTRGESITEAAYTAGFADAAHLSRTFRRMLGFSPSTALRVSQFVQAALSSTCEACSADGSHPRTPSSLGGYGGR